MSDSTTEIKQGERFAFGENWSHFLEVVDEGSIRDAEVSLQGMLKLERLDGMTFLDAGCGSGLFSLAAWRLGAKVHSFDYDPQSVATTIEMRRRYGNNANNSWHIETGSVLDVDYLSKLGQFDIVYSWGVLHHTGNMWQAIENICTRVSQNGCLFIALYNNQGKLSDAWTYIKRAYNNYGRTIRTLISASYHALVLATRTITGIYHRKPVKKWYKGSERGMSLWIDTVDWVGGYPFETATPTKVIDFFYNNGFKLEKLIKKNGSGCNEFIFQKNTTLHKSLAR